MTNTVNAPAARPPASTQTKTGRPRLLRWHPARLLYLFVITLVAGILYSAVQALLTNPAATLDPTQLRKTLFWQAASAYPLYVAVACVLAVSTAVLGWRLDRRYSSLREEQRHQETAATARVVAEQVVQRAQAGGQLTSGTNTIPRELPPRVPGFVGRQRELDNIAAALRQGQAVAIVGMGGLGKSSLAAEVVHALAAEPGMFPGGITWVRCDEREGLSGLTWIEDQLLAAWGASVSPEVTARAAAPEDGLALRERALRQRLGASDGDGAGPTMKLVLLDNVESGLPLARVLDILQPLGVTSLVTTRVEPSSQRIRLRNLDVLDAEAAVRLFGERYADRGGAWDAAEDTAAAMAIVEVLGGLPLAIELAAARAARTRLPLAALAGELRAPDALGRLSDPVDPSAGVRYSLGKTLLALSPTERACFVALGLPEGRDWPIPVVEPMLKGMPASTPPVVVSARADLEALAVYSLVGLAAARGGDGPRIHLHPLVRDLAREEFAQEAEATQRAALAGLITGVQAWVTEHRADFVVLARDEDLIVGTLRAAARAQVEVPLIVATIRVFDAYLSTHNIALREELAKLQLASARAVGDRKGELIALHRLAGTFALLGRHDEQYAYAREAPAVAHALGDPKELASALGAAASAAADQGHGDEARRLYDEGRSIGASLETGPGMAGTFSNLADAAARVGNLQEAASMFARALESARLGGVHPVTMVVILSNYGEVCSLLGDYAAARSYLEEAAQFVHGFQSEFEAGSLDLLGEVALQTGDVETATRLFHEAAQILEHLQLVHESVQLLAHVRGNLAATGGEAARLRGDGEEARRRFEEALGIFEGAELPSTHYTRAYEDFVRERLAMLAAMTGGKSTGRPG
jgi:tetratricopeptide (TPR) repeat protein